MTLSFDPSLSTLIVINYRIILYQQEILMKSFVQTPALIITAVFIFGCPPQHEEPVSGSFVPISKSEHLDMGNPSNAVDSVSYSNNCLVIEPHYVVSYNRDRGISNRVTWNSDNMWPGSVPRNDIGLLSNPRMFLNLPLPL